MSQAAPLSERIAAGPIPAEEVETLARALARWQLRFGHRPADGRAASPVALASRVRDVMRQLRPQGARLGLDSSDLAAMETLQDEALTRGLEAFLDRLEAGRIREVHGDLRAEVLAVDAGGALQVRLPARKLPRDLAEDLARLVADLTVGGAAATAEQLVADWVTETDDFGAYPVLDFYERHQSCRLAEECLADRERAVRARRYALNALAVGRRPLLPPVVVALTGPVASGKSTVARELARQVGAPRVVADRVRDVLLGVLREVGEDAAEEAAGHEADWLRSFSAGFEERVYDAVLGRARQVLASGRAVVIDACLPTSSRRREAAALARAHGVPFWLVECQVDEAVLRERWAERDRRDGASPGTWAQLAQRLAERREPRHPDEPGGHLVLDTAAPLQRSMERVRSSVPTWPEGFPG